MPLKSSTDLASIVAHPPSDDIRFRELQSCLSSAADQSLLDTLVRVVRSDARTYSLVWAGTQVTDQSHHRAMDALALAFRQFKASGKTAQDWKAADGALMVFMEVACSPPVIPLLIFAIGQLLVCVDDESSYVTPRWRQQFEPVCSILIPSIKELGFGQAALAECLANWHLEFGTAWFADCASMFCELLGAEGCLHYRDIAEHCFAQHLINDDCLDHSSCRPAAVVKLAAASAILTEPFQQLLQADLKDVDGYISLIELYDMWGLKNKATEVAQVGIKSLPAEDTRQLHNYLVAGSVESGHLYDGAQQLFEAFMNEPTVTWYHDLRDYCTQDSDSLDWQDWKAKVFAFLNSFIETVIEEDAPRRFLQANSIMVELLCEDKRYADAWRAAGRGCHHDTLLDLASQSNDSSFEDVRTGVETTIKKLLAINEKWAEDRAVELLLVLRRAARASRSEHAFATYIETLKGNRKFSAKNIKLLK